MADDYNPIATMSHSKAEMWLRCQFQFYCRYMLGIKRAPTAAMALGRSADRVAKDYFEAKLANGADLAEDDLLERWHEAWRSESEHVELWDEDGDSPSKLEQKGDLTVARWREKVAKLIEPIAVAVWFELPLDEGWTINGEVDLVQRLEGSDDRPILSDLKMTSKRWAKRKALESMQPAIYCTAMDHATDLDVNTTRFQFQVGVLYDPATKKKTTDPVQVLTRRMRDEEKTGALARLAVIRRQIMHAMKSGDFVPNRLATTCSRRHCGYWRECERKFGPRVPD